MCVCVCVCALYKTETTREERGPPSALYTRCFARGKGIVFSHVPGCLPFLLPSLLSYFIRYYILFDLVPSRKLTGGPWYTDAELDTQVRG